MTRLYIIEQSALAPGGHYYAYTRTVAEAAQRSGMDVVVLENHRFKGNWDLPGLTVVPAFTHTWGEADKLWITDWGVGNVAYEFAAATRRLPPRPGDHVLFHTLSYAELRALLTYLGEQTHTTALPFFHILLRYDPDVLEGSLEIYRPLFARIANSPTLRSRVLFHTDTDLLSQAYSRLAGVPFTTLPIPFAQDRLVERLSAPKTGPTDAPRSIIYLGDARLEKNFGRLPAAIAELWDEFIQPGKLRFVLQSNLNTPGGETGIMPALQRLGQYAARHVELAGGPMTPDEYYTRLADADAVIIPYDAMRYQARSSGVLVEAMAAGKPVITSAGSWMATQVSGKHAVLFDDPSQIGQAVATLMRDFDRYKRGAEALAARTLKWSSGTNFVQSLVASAPQEPTKLGPHVVVVMDGDAMVLRNGASRVADAQFAYLKAAGYRVTGIFVTHQRDLAPEALLQRATLLKQEVARYGLERVFLTGPGRYATDTCQQLMVSQDYDYSVAVDIGRVSSYDLNAEALRYFAETSVDAVLLNYITNYPVVDAFGLGNRPLICETHDIQSFQKAIYGGRPVRADDLDDEFELLAKCDHLLSLSPSETSFIGDRLDDVPVTTTGIFIDPKRISTGTLAGCRNLAEVLASCDPEEVRYQFEKAWIEGVSEDIARLANLDTLDIVYVSSNHSANVSGLRWFLDEIYEPYLAPAGVSMIVAGSISEVRDWPKYPRVHFVGRVNDVAPLYAASRVAVLPIIEGAGMPVKTAEALSYGCPIVATTVAMRGMGSDVDGVVVTDVPEAFAGAILELLASSETRRDLGMKARSSSEKIGGRARYSDLMDSVFAEVITHKPSRRTATASTEPPQPVEWTSLLRLANRLVRSWLENEPLEAVDIRGLATFQEQDIFETIDRVVDAVVVNRSAPLLNSNNRLLRTVASTRVSSHGETFKGLVGLLRQRLRESENPPWTGSEFRLLRLQNQPLDIWVYSPLTASVVGGIEDQSFASIDGGSSLYRATSPALERTGYSFGVVSGTVLEGRSAVVVASQKIGLDRDASILGESVAVKLTPAGTMGHVVALADGETVALSLPRLLSSETDAAFIDLKLAAGSSAELLVSLDGQPVSGRSTTGIHGTTYRFRLVDAAGGEESTKVSISVTAYGGGAVILSAQTHTVIGDGPEEALAAIDAAHALTASAPSADLTPRLPIRDLMEACRTGEPLRREAANMLRNHYAGRASGDVSSMTTELKKDLEFDLSNAAGIDAHGAGGADAARAYAILWPAEAIELVHLAEADSTRRTAASDLTIVASRGITVELQADFADVTAAAQAMCEIGGEGVVADENDASTTRTWRRTGRSQPNPDWLHRVSVTDAAGRLAAPTEVRAQYRFVAMQDLATERRFLKLTNVYESEMLGPDVGQVWTGPGLRTLMSIPIALTGWTSVAIDLSNVGACASADDIAIALNGTPLDVAFERDGTSGIIRGYYHPRTGSGPASAELTVFTRRTFEAPGDPRRLGICIRAITLTQTL